MITLESRVERYKKSKINKRHRLIKIVVFIFAITLFIAGLDTVDRAVRGMMHVEDRQLYFFNYDGELYKLHLLGRDYMVEKKDIDDKIDNAKVIIEDITKLADNYLDKIWTKIKTR